MREEVCDANVLRSHIENIEVVINITLENVDEGRNDGTSSLKNDNQRNECFMITK